MGEAFCLKPALRRAGMLSREGGIARNDHVKPFNPSAIALRSHQKNIQKFL
jgi:hypothetical protein